MSLVIHYWIGDVQDCQGVSASEMSYIVSSGALNSTHSLTTAQKRQFDHSEPMYRFVTADHLYPFDKFCMNQGVAPLSIGKSCHHVVLKFKAYVPIVFLYSTWPT